MPPEIVLASGNRGKLAELAAMLSGCAVSVRPQSDFSVPEAEEDGLTFVENALKKARNAARYCDRPALADDSGIAVDALSGAPGIYSARYAGAGASDEQNLAKLLQDMADVPDGKRQCRFICVIAFLRHADDPTPIICQGEWSGSLLRAPRGAHGFGYDPIFYVPERDCSSAELEPVIKNTISHRGLALGEFVSAVQQLYPPVAESPR
ncbi:MAG: RdgB/HAM1 family non-canonical purine NTP pyrophosphatase [Gammaproteobacteria bacterium]|jgi:XTP/dITP diphosphohydrolase